MLNRRQIRIKALQMLYAYYQSGSTDMAATEKSLHQNMDKLYDLYIWQLSLLVEVHDFAEAWLEEAKKKQLPTEEDLNPNTKFIDNRFIHKLRNNKDYRANTQHVKTNWGSDQDLVRKIFLEIRESSFYSKYMNSKDDNFENDKSVLVNITRKVLIGNELLRDYFEEKYFLWSEDYYMALSFIIHTLNDLGSQWAVDDSLLPLFKKSYDNDGKNEDEDFLYSLVRTVIKNTKKYDDMIINKAINWEFDRIAVMDLILLRIGMAEIFEFETIPLKVTLNEVIEFAKHFSSPKSKVFINGLLDKTIEEGLKNETIVKKGRGLIGQ